MIRNDKVLQILWWRMRSFQAGHCLHSESCTTIVGNSFLNPAHLAATELRRLRKPIQVHATENQLFSLPDSVFVVQATRDVPGRCSDVLMMGAVGYLLLSSGARWSAGVFIATGLFGRGNAAGWFSRRARVCRRPAQHWFCLARFL